MLFQKMLTPVLHAPCLKGSAQSSSKLRTCHGRSAPKMVQSSSYFNERPAPGRRCSFIKMTTPVLHAPCLKRSAQRPSKQRSCHGRSAPKMVQSSSYFNEQPAPGRRCSFIKMTTPVLHARCLKGSAQSSSKLRYCHGRSAPKMVQSSSYFNERPAPGRRCSFMEMLTPV